MAFATVAASDAALAYALKNATNTHDLSEQWLFFCNPSGSVGSCSNGWYPTSGAAAVANYGLQQEACYPYLAHASCAGKCSSFAQTQWGGKWTITSFSTSQVQAAKDFIAAGGAITTFFYVYNDFFNYRSGVYVYDGVSAYAGGHAVTVIGFDDAQGYWVVKNSWGTGWGESGYFRIAYGQCGIMSGASGNMIGFTFVRDAPAPSPSPAPAVCGNGACEAGETCSSCAADCGACPICGDRVCNGAETCATCPGDCGSCCGNGKCESGYGETCTSCALDCGACPVCDNNGVCNIAGGESCSNCPGDCGVCNSRNGWCGNGRCDYSTSRNGYREGCARCPKDCGSCAAPSASNGNGNGNSAAGICGDSVCSPGETPVSCPADCANTWAPGLADWMFPGLGKGSNEGVRKCVVVNGKCTAAGHTNYSAQHQGRMIT